MVIASIIQSMVFLSYVPIKVRREGKWLARLHPIFTSSLHKTNAETFSKEKDHSQTKRSRKKKVVRIIVLQQRVRNRHASPVHGSDTCFLPTRQITSSGHMVRALLLQAR